MNLARGISIDFCEHGCFHGELCPQCPNEIAHALNDPTPQSCWELRENLGRGRCHEQRMMTDAQAELANERAELATGGECKWIKAA